MTNAVSTWAKRMTLTDFKIDIPRLANKKTLKAALESAGER